jgi:hypothetical protein
MNECREPIKTSLLIYHVFRGFLSRRAPEKKSHAIWNYYRVRNSAVHIPIAPSAHRLIFYLQPHPSNTNSPSTYPNHPRFIDTMTGIQNGHNGPSAELAPGQ